METPSPCGKWRGYGYSGKYAGFTLVSDSCFSEDLSTLAMIRGEVHLVGKYETPRSVLTMSILTIQLLSCTTRW
jgi:hypothetical protein